MQTRHVARTLALQSLYEIDFTNHFIDDVLQRRLEEQPLPDEAATFLKDLVTGVLEYREKLDALIHTYAPDWPVQQMAVIDRNILRMAIYELAFHNQTPAKVAINEAVELAKAFGSESTARFVNGVLGSVIAGQTEDDDTNPGISRDDKQV